MIIELSNDVVVKLSWSEEDIVKQINEHLDSMLEDYSDGDYDAENQLFYGLYEQKPRQTIKDVNNERERLKKSISDIYNDKNKLESIVNGVGTKKNGKFRKNAINEFERVESITDFFTDFTNAWNSLSIRLVAKDENTVELELKTKTYTF